MGNGERGQLLLTHSTSKRGFQSLHAAKTAFGSVGRHRIGEQSDTSDILSKSNTVRENLK